MIKKMKRQIDNHPKRRIILGLICFTALVLIIICYRVYASIVLKNQTQADELPVVHTLIAKPMQGTEQLILPGNVTAWHDAVIYARTSGYIKKWYVDIGSQVKEGQLLAEIETPELDAQLRQAEADLNTAIANNKIAQSTAKRWLNLSKSQSVSKQETDEKVSTGEAQKALVIAAQANVDRLKKLVGFERVVAPFDGTITSRTTDVGSLINAGSSSTAVPLFQIAQTNPLRVYVKIPQNYSSRITPEMKIKLIFSQQPGKTYSAQLLKTAGALDPASRTLLAQFKVDNQQGELLAGGYTEVTLDLPIPANVYRLPVNVLLFQAAGLQIATVDKNHQVVLKPIQISRDFGSEVEVKSGISQGEQIIINPSDSISTGDRVRISP